MTVVDDFVELFSGRYDAYGSWTGGMVPNPNWPYQSTNGDPRDFIKDHLDHGPYIGIYPVTDDNLTGWGCIDIDGKNHTDADGIGDWSAMWTIVAELQDVLAYKDCDSWIERTVHGFHLWVFAVERVPAATMRRALQVACQVALYDPKEVNPKSEFVDASKPYGNYVRLPYYGVLADTLDPRGRTNPPDRFIVDTDGVPLTLEQFSRAATGSRVSVETLESMSTLYAPPEVKASSVLTDAATEDAFRMIEPILPPVVKMIFADGPLGDRSSAMVKTCVILRDEGWQAQAVFVVLKALDARLGKFVGRPDQDDRLLDIVSKVGL